MSAHERLLAAEAEVNRLDVLLAWSVDCLRPFNESSAEAIENTRRTASRHTTSLIVSQPSTVSSLIDTAVQAGATTLKPVQKSMRGYGGVVQAPNGTIWKVATSAKKDTGPATRQVDQIVLLMAATDVATSKRFYVDHGLAVGKSFGKYVEFALPDGTGSHRLAIGSDAGPFTDPDGFAWEAASA